MKRANELLSQRGRLQFSSGEPYKCMLRMLYDYFAPEEAEDAELRRFLNNIRWELAQIIIKYFQEYGTEEIVPTLVDFLLPRPDYLYSIRDLLYIIMLYQCPPQRRGAASVIVSQLNALCKSRRNEFDLVAALHLLISNSIDEKERLQRPSVIDEPSFARRKVDCCDHIISYAMHILLGLSWGSVLEAEDVANPFVALITGAISSSSSQKGQHSAIVSEMNGAFVKGESFLSYLNPTKGKGRLGTPEEIILNFLFHRPRADPKKEAYERQYLGEKTYLALLSHILPEPAVFYLEEKELPQRILELRNVSGRARMVYGKIIENIRAFELPVQRRIVLDTCRFLESKSFLAAFLHMENVFETVAGYLCKPRYLGEPTLKASLEKFYLLYMASYWKVGQARQGTLFRDMWALTVPEFLLVSNKLVDHILAETTSSAPVSDDCLCSLAQFVYFLEDAAIRIPHIIIQGQYIELVAKVMLCLNAAKMLYFWYPSFVHGHVPRNPPVGLEDCCQREGGVVRTMLKLILGIVVRSNRKCDLDDAHMKLPLKLLSFFVFRKKKTQKTIERILKLKFSELPGTTSDPESFLNFKASADARIKLILHDKCVGHQKTVEEIAKSVAAKKDPFESQYYRGLLLVTEITQAIVYTAYGASSYREVLSQLQASGAEPSYRLVYLSKLLAKTVRACLVGGEAALMKGMDELCRDVIRSPEYQIENCYSNFDMLTKESLEVARPSIIESPKASSKIHGRTSGASTESEAELMQRARKFQEECVATLVQISEKYAVFQEKKLSVTDFAEAILDVVTTAHFLKSVQKGLHRLVSEDFLLIERMVLFQVDSRPKVTKHLSDPHAQAKE